MTETFNHAFFFLKGIDEPLGKAAFQWLQLRHKTGGG
jgi:hypothetical protein